MTCLAPSAACECLLGAHVVRRAAESSLAGQERAFGGIWWSGESGSLPRGVPRSLRRVYSRAGLEIGAAPPPCPRADCAGGAEQLAKRAGGRKRRGPRKGPERRVGD